RVRSGLEVDETERVATVERQILHLLLADGRRDVGRGRLDELFARRDRDRLTHTADLEVDDERKILTDVDLHALSDFCLEALGIDRHGIDPNLELGQREDAAVFRNATVFRLRAFVDDTDRRPGDDVTLRILDRYDQPAER